MWVLGLGRCLRKAVAMQAGRPGSDHQHPQKKLGMAHTPAIPAGRQGQEDWSLELAAASVNSMVSERPYLKTKVKSNWGRHEHWPLFTCMFTWTHTGKVDDQKDFNLCYIIPHRDRQHPVTIFSLLSEGCDRELPYGVMLPSASMSPSSPLLPIPVPSPLWWVVGSVLGTGPETWAVWLAFHPLSSELVEQNKPAWDSHYSACFGRPRASCSGFQGNQHSRKRSQKKPRGSWPRPLRVKELRGGPEIVVSKGGYSEVIVPNVSCESDLPP